MKKIALIFLFALLLSGSGYAASPLGVGSISQAVYSGQMQNSQYGNYGAIYFSATNGNSYGILSENAGNRTYTQQQGGFGNLRLYFSGNPLYSQVYTAGTMAITYTDINGDNTAKIARIPYVSLNASSSLYLYYDTTGRPFINANLTIPAINNAPVFSQTANQQVNENSLLQFIINATDTDNDNITYSATAMPAGALFNATNRAFSWTPNLTQAGNYNATFSANDSYTTSQMTVNISVINALSPLTLVLYSPLNITYNRTNISLQYTAVSIDGIDRCWYRLNNGSITNISNCANTTFIANEGNNSLILYSNTTAGANESRAGMFAIDTAAPNITNITTSPQFPINVNGSQNISVNFTSSEFPLNAAFNIYNSTGSLVYTTTIIVNNSSQLPIIFTLPSLADGSYTLVMVALGSFTVSIPDITPPVADFTFIAAIEGQLTVFTSNSTDNIGIVRYLWMFGDGINSTLQNPNHTYAQNRTYTVILNVSDTVNNTGQMQKNITINDTIPIAGFNVGVVVRNLNTQFTDSSTAYDNISSWFWSFGDGANSTLQNPAHNYTQNNTYVVILTVSDSDGSVSSFNRSVVVLNQAGANFTMPLTAQEGILVQFTDNSTGTNITSWLWRFGDGANSTLRNPNHTYVQNRTYTVNLTITDNGQLFSATADIIITDTGPIAESGNNQSIELGNIAFFNSSGSSAYDNITLYFWNFGDGANATGVFANHTYNAAGIFVAILTVTDSDASISSDNLTVIVSDTRVPLINIQSPQNRAYNTTNVSLLFTAVDLALDKAWYNIDNSTNTTLPGNTTFITTEGQHVLYLYANDSSGNKNSTQLLFSVDTTIPNITNISTSPTLPITTNGTGQNISVNFNSTEFPINAAFNIYNSTGSLVYTTTIIVNNSSQLPIIFTLPSLADGSYTLVMVGY
ncbi:MAG: PKD domain-containing protein [Candidatus Aenigmarchaeota archaeon]|nr:PKD domain-containing protein [Candidatus Aenigmarchaeota archaeon]